MNIVIADNQLLFRQGLREYLLHHKLSNNVLETDSKDQLLSLLKNESPDIVLSDIDFSEQNGLKIIETIVNNYPKVKILVISMYESDEMISHIIDLGVHGYLSKSSSSKEFEYALNRIYEDGYFYNHRVTTIIRNSILKPGKVKEMDRLVYLTNRELIILRLICDEKTTKEIAKILEISPRTVDDSRKDLLVKTKTKNMVGLIKYAVMNGLYNL
ncbi:MAG: response regulator transcription factor [Cyclobacteriaceae bacterium]|nr:response regulator transcription factor [Cyclobacteriaceae bacterium]